MALVLVTVSVTGCGSPERDEAGAQAEGDPDHIRVEVTADGFVPSYARVLVGGTVTFVNVDPARPHTAETGVIASDPAWETNAFNTHTLTWREPYTVTFNKPGTVRYHDAFSRDAEGIVEVVVRAPPQP